HERRQRPELAVVEVEVDRLARRLRGLDLVDQSARERDVLGGRPLAPVHRRAEAEQRGAEREQGRHGQEQPFARPRKLSRGEPLGHAGPIMQAGMNAALPLPFRVARSGSGLAYAAPAVSGRWLGGIFPRVQPVAMLNPVTIVPSARPNAAIITPAMRMAYAAGRGASPGRPGSLAGPCASPAPLIASTMPPTIRSAQKMSTKITPMKSLPLARQAAFTWPCGRSNTANFDPTQLSSGRCHAWLTVRSCPSSSTISPTAGVVSKFSRTGSSLVPWPSLYTPTSTVLSSPRARPQAAGSPSRRYGLRVS